MKKMMAVLLVMLGLVMSAQAAMAAERVIAGFEKDAEGWEIPEWALEKTDHVATTVAMSNEVALDGAGSLKIDCDFPGKIWTAAIVETSESFDFTPYEDIACSIYLPKEAPEGLKAKIILTVGEEWKFVEMARSVALIPGQWNTITGSLVAGSTSWQKMTADDNFRADIRKISIRVESNKKPEYKGPIYIDAIKVVGK